MNRKCEVCGNGMREHLRHVHELKALDYFRIDGILVQYQLAAEASSGSAPIYRNGVFTHCAPGAEVIPCTKEEGLALMKEGRAEEAAQKAQEGPEEPKQPRAGTKAALRALAPKRESRKRVAAQGEFTSMAQLTKTRLLQGVPQADIEAEIRRCFPDAKAWAQQVPGYRAQLIKEGKLPAPDGAVVAAKPLPTPKESKQRKKA